jgi:hypothetical protein
MNTDPLEWCAANEINFQELSVMARQYQNVGGFKDAAAATPPPPLRSKYIRYR